MIINHGGEEDGDVILGHDDLLGHLDDLDADVDGDEGFGEDVYFDQPRVDGAVEAAEFCDEADVALADGLVGVWADDAAGDCAEVANDGAEGVDWGSSMSVWARGGGWGARRVGGRV